MSGDNVYRARWKKLWGDVAAECPRGKSAYHHDHTGGAEPRLVHLHSVRDGSVRCCFARDKRIPRPFPDTGEPYSEAYVAALALTVTTSCPTWGTEPVDGAGLALPAHAAAIANLVCLDEMQTATLVAELRNALVPISAVPGAELAVERVLALARALAGRTR